jgi:hypothetical protein
VCSSNPQTIKIEESLEIDRFSVDWMGFGKNEIKKWKKREFWSELA